MRLRRSDMNEMIKHLYIDSKRNIQSGVRESEGLHKKIKEVVKDNLQILEGEEFEKICDTALLACDIGEENGFVKGFKYAYFLFIECIQEDI